VDHFPLAQRRRPNQACGAFVADEGAFVREQAEPGVDSDRTSVGETIDDATTAYALVPRRRFQFHDAISCDRTLLTLYTIVYIDNDKAGG
jgi:hypothetical protein